MPNSTQAMIAKCPNCGAANRVTFAAADKMPVCGRCKTPLPPPSAEPVLVTDANYSQTVESSPVPVLLDLWAPWCGPCRILAPTVEMIARELAGRALVGKLNVDENPRTAAKFNVQGIPTLIIAKGGREVDRIVGVQSREAILQRLNPHLA